ncbi:DNA polymerase III subunit delta [Candidatus Pelagibacter sp. RS40]|uniref:DNA polymerase III subunit delta n=1 Tax=Candidatus Pelagibacter sp. RS40 TaxID=1977865 RepID=UPI000A146772|nr:DNA polymerase III subunit delta [Candidatus Pelagibacter sp. RS40]ARJ49069.1 DNA polymerase III subunit delta [Candidatus Pelagibacter sp. RS40]
MIIKSFDVNKVKFSDFKSILLYGLNRGFKEEVIKHNISFGFTGEILCYEESEVLDNKDTILEDLINGSLFGETKLMIISRSSNKILDFIEEFLERNISNVQIIINSENLDKKSKLRSLFEKDKKLACIPFYEDNNQSLNIFAIKFIKEKNIKISQETLNLIVERARGDRGNLNSELQKLEALSLTKKKITQEDIFKLTNLSEDYGIFELVDNYLAKNKIKVSKILNENNFVNDDCILILRTLLSRSKRLLKLKNIHKEKKNIDEVISSYKPSIFWKEKDLVKQQIKNWSEKEIKEKIYQISNLEILTKKNTSSINLVSDLISNY